MRTTSALRALPRVAAVTGLVTLLTAGCSQGTEDVSGNRPDPSPSQAQVVRTPSPLGTDLPYSDPPILQRLPGPSGGVPGVPNERVPEASPGEDADGGGGPAN